MHFLASRLRKKWRLSPQRMLINQTHQENSSLPSTKKHTDSASLYASLLKMCGESGAIGEGRRVHAHIAANGFDQDTLLANSIVQMYGSCGCIEEAEAVYSKMNDRNVYSETIMLVAFSQNGKLDQARNLFDAMSDRSPVSWNAIISAYAQNSRSHQSLQLFRLMQQDGFCRPNRSTFVNVLGACADLAALQVGKLVHANALECGFGLDFMVATAIVNMYGKCGSVRDARRLFEAMTRRTVISWTVMLSAYAQNGHMLESKQLFDRIPEWSVTGWNSMISAYSQSRRIREARALFDEMVMQDLTSWNLMIDVYAQAGSLPEADDLFGKMPCRCVVSWTTMLTAYAQSSRIDRARDFFARMPLHDSISWNAMISAFGQNGHVEDAKNLFEKLERKNPTSWNAMMVAYAQNGSLIEARHLFDVMLGRNLASWGTMFAAYTQNGELEEAKSLFNNMPHKDVFAWNSMISAYARVERDRDALQVFAAMESTSAAGGFEPNEQSYVGALDACGKLGALREGETIHAKILKRGLEQSSLVATALIEMYGKCGSLVSASAVFWGISGKELLSWNTIVSVYGQNGHGNEAMVMFQQMQAEGTLAEPSTFMILLTVCSHSGMLKQGRQVFLEMVGDYEVEAVIEHYLCLVDLLGRAGLVDKAEELLMSMPYEASSVAWTSLLSACNTQADKRRGASAATVVFEIDKEDSAGYTLLSNLYCLGLS